MDQRAADEKGQITEKQERLRRVFQSKEEEIRSTGRTSLFEELTLVERLDTENNFYVSFMKGTSHPYYYLLKELDLGMFEKDPESLRVLRDNLQFWKVMSFACSFFMRIYDVKEICEQNTLQIISEYSPNESLQKSNRVLNDEDAPEEEDIFTIFVEILCAIEYLELLGLNYGLFTPSSVQKRALRNYVLLPPIFSVTKDIVKNTIEICPGFVPPEIQGLDDPNTSRSTASDIYCLGSLLYFLLEKSYPGEEFELQFGENLDDRWEQIVQKMRKQNPYKRPTISEIFNSRAFKELAKKSRIDVSEKRFQVYNSLGAQDLFFKNFRSKKTKKTNCCSKPENERSDQKNLSHMKKQSKPNSAKPMRFLSEELSDMTEDNNYLAETRSESIEDNSSMQDLQNSKDSIVPMIEDGQKQSARNVQVLNLTETPFISGIIYFGSHLLTNLPLILNQCKLVKMNQEGQKDDVSCMIKVDADLTHRILQQRPNFPAKTHRKIRVHCCHQKPIVQNSKFRVFVRAFHKPSPTKPLAIFSSQTQLIFRVLIQ